MDYINLTNPSSLERKADRAAELVANGMIATGMLLMICLSSMISLILTGWLIHMAYRLLKLGWHLAG